MNALYGMAQGLCAPNMVGRSQVRRWVRYGCVPPNGSYRPAATTCRAVAFHNRRKRVKMARGDAQAKTVSTDGAARRNRLRVVSASYRPYPGRYGNTHCAYCGVPADTVDHVPNLSYRMAMGKTACPDCWLVDCCRECNSLLANSILTTFTGRRGYIAKRLRRKYAAILRMPKWTLEELGEMGYNLRVKIENSDDLADYIRRRISYAAT